MDRIVKPVMSAPPEKIGPYRIIRKIGEGGMGAVYEGLHELIERKVALKILRPQFAVQPEFTARFFNEARAVNRVDHPGVVQISDYGQLPDSTAYIVMEFLQGEVLSSRIKGRGGPLPLEQALNIGSQLADCLTAAHEKNVIHRDLKPDNVMLVADSKAPGGERTKLLDFGIAKLAPEDNNDPGLTRPGVVFGTPTYMSPEQCKGAKEVDARSDVYSLGVIFYQMLAGRPPFVGEGVGVVVLHMHEEPQPIIELGKKGTLRGREYTVLGHIRRDIIKGGEGFWDEYLLWTGQPSDSAFHYLVFSGGHFTLVEPINYGDITGSYNRQYQGTQFKHVERCTTKVSHLAGEFPWAVEIGEKVNVDDSAAPQKGMLLSLETTEGEKTKEINASVGYYLESEEVFKGFSLSGVPPAKEWVAPHQPNPHAEPLARQKPIFWNVAVWCSGMVGITRVRTTRKRSCGSNSAMRGR